MSLLPDGSLSSPLPACPTALCCLPSADQGIAQQLALDRRSVLPAGWYVWVAPTDGKTLYLLPA